MKKSNLFLYFLWSLSIVSCDSQSSSNDEQSEISIQNANDSFSYEESEAVLTDELSQEEQLKEYLKKHEFEKASLFIEDQLIDLNELYVSNRGRTWIVGTTYLTEFIPTCDTEIISYLLNQNASPNIAQITYGYEEWSGSSFSEDISLNDLIKNGHDGFVIEESPLEKAIGCEDSTIFYTLIEADANTEKEILKGAIKWNDIPLVKKSVATNVIIDFVPQTNNKEILSLLMMNTNGEQYSELGFGEGGDIFDSDLMYAISEGNKELVWFMLKTGADPNHCMPTNSVNGEFIGPDSNGYYPAVTPLSMAKDGYQNNKRLSEKREENSHYHQKLAEFKEIMSLLEEYGATEIKKCFGP